MFKPLVSIFSIITIINAHFLAINEYSSEVCSYVNQSINIEIQRAHEDTQINYLIFHYKDILISDIPTFTNHSIEAPIRCVAGEEREGCSHDEGYDIHFDSDEHDPILNSVFNKNKKSDKYDVKSPGFYCIYLDTTDVFSGVVQFNNDFSVGLGIDNYTRFIFDLKFMVVAYFLLVTYVLIKRYHWRMKAFVGAVGFIYAIRTITLGMVSKFGKNFWTITFHTIFNNLIKNMIIGTILLWIMYHSVGYKIVKDESMIFKNTRIMEVILLSYVGITCVNEFYFNVSMIPYYDLHFNSFRRYFLLLEYIPAILIYVSSVFEFIQLQRDFEIEDTRIKVSFMLITVFAPLVGVFKLILGAFVVHRLHDPRIYDWYYKDYSILLMTFFTDLLILPCIVYLCYIWRPQTYQLIDQYQEPDVELDDFRV